MQKYDKHNLTGRQTSGIRLRGFCRVARRSRRNALERKFRSDSSIVRTVSLSHSKSDLWLLSPISKNQQMKHALLTRSCTRVEWAGGVGRIDKWANWILPNRLWTWICKKVQYFVCFRESTRSTLPDPGILRSICRPSICYSYLPIG